MMRRSGGILWSWGELKAPFHWRQATKDKNHRNKELNCFLRIEALLATVGERIFIFR